MDFTVGGTVENRGGRFIIVDSITLHSLTSTPARIELDQVSANVPIVMTPEFSIGNGSLSTTAESTGAVIAENVHNFAGSISGNLSVELLVRTTGERGTFTNEADVSPGNSPGTIQILGNFEQTGSGHLLMEIAGTTPGLEHDQLLVSGEATLGGELEVVLLDGFTPSAGGLFDLFDWGSVVGTFEVVSLPALGAGLQWDTTALYTQGQLCVLAVGIPGDYNHNGIVDAADYTVYRNNAGTTNGLVNDPIGGTIGLAQYNQWKAHFGQTAGSGAGTIASTPADAAVPEPASVVLCLLVATVAVGMRSRLDRIADGHRVRYAGFAVRRYFDRRWLMPFLVLALLGTSVCNADLLLYVSGVEGDATLVGYQGWSDVDDFAISVKQGVPSPLYVSAPTSSITPHMFFFALGQQNIDKVTLEFVANNPSLPLTSVAAWALTDARVTEFSTAGDSDGNSTDRYTIDYRAIQYRYSTDTGDIVVQWDRNTGVPTIIDNSNGGSIAIFTGNPDLLPPMSGLPGDYNQNGIVDAADYTVWRNNDGTTNALANDPIGGTIGPAQYALWKAHFGQTAGSGSGSALPSAESLSPAVPEPATYVLALCALVGVLCTATGNRVPQTKSLRESVRSTI